MSSNEIQYTPPNLAYWKTPYFLYFRPLFIDSERRYIDHISCSIITKRHTFAILYNIYPFKSFSKREILRNVVEMGGRVSIVNKTSFTIKVQLCHLSPLYTKELEPNEVWSQETGAVHFTIKVDVQPRPEANQNSLKFGKSGFWITFLKSVSFCRKQR